MSTDVQLRTWQYIPEDSELHTRRRENLKSHMDWIYLVQGKDAVINLKVAVVIHVSVERLWTAAINAPTVILQVIYKHEQPWWNGSDWGKPNNAETKPVPVPLCPSQIPHGLTPARNRTSAVRDLKLTTWTIAYTYIIDRAMAQAVSFRSFAAEVQVRARISPCRTSADEVALGHACFRVLQFSPVTANIIDLYEQRNDQVTVNYLLNWNCYHP
jgi:hypothetical protein